MALSLKLGETKLSIPSSSKITLEIKLGNRGWNKYNILKLRAFTLNGQLKYHITKEKTDEQNHFQFLFLKFRKLNTQV